MTRKEKQKLRAALASLMSDEADGFQVGVSAIAGMVGVTLGMDLLKGAGSVSAAKIASGPSSSFMISLPVTGTQEKP